MLLANSRKWNARCLAGIDQVTGRWIRPVSSLVGICHSWPANLINDIDVFDVIEYKSSVPQPLNYHPEDELLLDQPKRVARLSDDEIQAMCGKLNASDVHEFIADRVAIAEEELSERALTCSLAACVCNEVCVYQAQHHDNMRCWFMLGNRKYELPCTDDYSIASETMTVGDVLHGRFLVCLSVGEPYRGYHYKLVATLRRLPE